MRAMIYDRGAEAVCRDDTRLSGLALIRLQLLPEQ
jgi:hypothetical protein